MRLVAGRNEQLIHGEKEPSMPSARRSGYRGSLKGDAAIRAEVGGESGPASLCANIVETPSYPFISEQGGKDDSLCW